MSSIHQSPARKALMPQQKIQQISTKDQIDFTNDDDFMVITYILNKSRGMRSYTETEIIVKAFSSFVFFQGLIKEMGLDQIYGLFKELQYEYMSKRETVFNYGDIGKNFYIIMRGSVYVLVMKQGLDAEKSNPQKQVKSKPESKTSKQQSINASKKHSIVDTGSAKDIFDKANDQMTDQEFFEANFPDMNQVGLIPAGQSFGEIALTKHMPRSATIVCKEETHFVTLSREKFNQFLSEYYNKVQQRNVQFLASIQVFSAWNETLLNQLYYHFEVREFPMNTLIYKEGQTADAIYLIHTGEIEISKQIQIQHSRKTENEMILSHFTKITGKNYTKSTRVRVSILSSGQMFGQEEIMKKQSKRDTMAVCAKDRTKLFILDRARFQTYCMNGLTLNQLEALFANQSVWRGENEKNLIKFESPPQLHFRTISKHETVTTNKTSRVESDSPRDKKVERHSTLPGLGASTHQISLNHYDTSQISETNRLKKSVVVDHVKQRVSEKSPLLIMTHIGDITDKFIKSPSLQRIVSQGQNLDIDNPYFSPLELQRNPQVQLMINEVPKLKSLPTLPKRRSHMQIIKSLNLPSVITGLSGNPSQLASNRLKTISMMVPDFLKSEESDRQGYINY